MKKVRDLNNMTAAEIASLTEEEIFEIECRGKPNKFINNNNAATVPAVLTVAPPRPVNTSIYSNDIGESKFIKKLNTVEHGRDYSIIVDASSSMFDGAWEGKGPIISAPTMSQQRWDNAKVTVAILAPLACKCDSNGISLYFFSDSYIKYPNIQSSETVEILFGMEENQFQGGTALHKVLSDSIKPDTVHSNGERAKPETILIITDGAPDDPTAVEQIIIHATRNPRIMRSGNDLSISIILIGDDSAAITWLQGLENRLRVNGALFDVVDIIHCDDLANDIKKVFPN